MKLLNFVDALFLSCVLVIARISLEVDGFVFDFPTPIRTLGLQRFSGTSMPILKRDFILSSASISDDGSSLESTSLEKPFMNPLEIEMIKAYDAKDVQRFLSLFKTIGLNTKSPLSSVISYFTPQFIESLTPPQAVGALTGLVHFGLIGNTTEQRQLCGNLFSKVCTHDNPGLPLETKDVLEALTTAGFKVSMAPEAKLENFIQIVRRDMPFYTADHLCQLLHLFDHWKDIPESFQKSILLKTRALNNKVLSVEQYANIILAYGRVQMELVSLDVDNVKMISNIAERGFSQIKNHDDEGFNQRCLVKFLTGLVGMRQRFDRMEQCMLANLELAIEMMYPQVDLQGFKNIVNALAKLDWYWFYGTGPMQRGFEKTLRRHMDEMTPREVDEMLVIVKQKFRGKLEFFPSKLQKMIQRKMRGLDEEHYDKFGNFKKPKPQIKRELRDDEVVQEIPEWVRKCLAEGPHTRPPIIVDSPPSPYWYASAMTRKKDPKSTRSTSSKHRIPPNPRAEG